MLWFGSGVGQETINCPAAYHHNGTSALLAFSGCLLWLFYRDGKDRALVSPAAWIVW